MAEPLPMEVEVTVHLSVDMLRVGLQRHSIQSHSFLYPEADVPTSRNFQTHPVQVRPCTAFAERMLRFDCSRKDLSWPTELVKAGRPACKSTTVVLGFAFLLTVVGQLLL